ncbi:hypothetical protein C0V72_02040 [Porphyrobacter sp. TH134]|uniref:acyltransferase family protein n=1 Tax=Porphyrobacter sp. TH134 TaxID=2067450 RepID=UPI000C7A3080|nr:acyltransferase family protein [Porphyrobacter sp. TH134]PLK25102.1 hypothetical protein C0V72_02040 [Porphyrobacter sp. TH134]
MRNQNIEVVRIIAAFGIVLVHSGATGAQIGYSGLVAFTMLATYFAGSDPAKLARRVLVPWAFWSMFYLAWRFAADGSPFHQGLSPVASVLYGTHLWFLPFIFAVNLALTFVTARWLPAVCAVVAFILLAGSPWWRELQLATEPPVTQFLHAIPAALLGVAFRQRIGMVIGALGLFACLLWDLPGVSLPYVVGGGAVFAALMLPHFPKSVEWASSCMFGVYLVHIAALGVFNRIFGQGELITAIVAFFASFAGVLIARHVAPWSRKILG